MGLGVALAEQLEGGERPVLRGQVGDQPVEPGVDQAPVDRDGKVGRRGGGGLVEPLGGLGAPGDRLPAIGLAPQVEQEGSRAADQVAEPQVVTGGA